jgi:hypothetical protein
MGIPITLYLSPPRQLHYCEQHKNCPDRPKWDTKHPDEVKQMILKAITIINSFKANIVLIGPGSWADWDVAVDDLAIVGNAFTADELWETECMTCWELDVYSSVPFLLGLLLLKEQQWFARCFLGIENLQPNWKEMYERLAAELEVFRTDI